MTDSIHLAMGIDSISVLNLVSKTIREKVELAAQDAIKIEIYPAASEEKGLNSVWVIMHHAHRNAMTALEATNAHVSISYARGKASVPFAKGYFPLDVIVAVAADGAIDWAIPPVYPRQFVTELRILCLREFGKLKRSTAHPRLQLAAGIAVQKWSSQYEDHAQYTEVPIN